MNGEGYIRFGNEKNFDFIVRRVGGNAGKAYILNEGETVSSQSNYFIKNKSSLSVNSKVLGCASTGVPPLFSINFIHSI